MLQLSEAGDDETSINRITGAANWQMPSHALSMSLPCSPTGHLSASSSFADGGGSRGGAWAAAAAAPAAGSSRPHNSGAQHGVCASVPASPAGRSAGMLGGSPLRVPQQPSLQKLEQGKTSPPLQPQGGGPSPRLGRGTRIAAQHASPRQAQVSGLLQGGAAREQQQQQQQQASALQQVRLILPLRAAAGGLVHAEVVLRHDGACAAPPRCNPGATQAAQRTLRSSASGHLVGGQQHINSGGGSSSSSSMKLRVMVPSSARDGE
jgi:hypothetical protein